MPKIWLFFIFAALLILTVAGLMVFNRQQSNDQPISNQDKPMALALTSSAFTNQAAIPTKYTCDGEDINPPLAFQNVPQNTKSLALIVDDPDAPAKVWVHWVVFNIKPDTSQIAEGSLPPGSILGTTDFGKTGWGGPCPPSGQHRYFFKLYALDAPLDLQQGASKEQVEAAMQGHIIEQAELVGLYQRS